MILQRCDGPSCPRCGCRDTEILKDAPPMGWWSTGRARCRHCARVFDFRRESRDERRESRVESQGSPATAAVPPIESGYTPPLPAAAGEYFPAENRDQGPSPEPAGPAEPPAPYSEPTGKHCPQCGQTGWVYRTVKGTQYRKCKACGATWKTRK